MRHPLAVAYSKLQLRARSRTEEWDTTLNKYMIQSDLVEDYLVPFISVLEDIDVTYQKTKNPFENCIVGWCIENYVPLMQIKEGLLEKDNVHICFYEDLCIDLRESSKKIFDYLGEELNGGVASVSSQPSSQAYEHSAVLSGKNLVGNWNDGLTQSQKGGAIDILRLFNLDSIYTLEALPNHKGLDVFIGRT